MTRATAENGAPPPCRAYLSPGAAARQSGLGLRTIARAIASGRLESYRVGGRRLIPAGALDAFIRGDGAPPR